MDLSDICGGRHGATVLWTPDSRRFAINYESGRYRLTALYQLRGEEWVVALKSPYDTDNGGKISRRLLEDSLVVTVHQWVDSNTAIVFLGGNSGFLLTLKFDKAGSWKVVKTHRMTEKESEKYPD